MRCTRLDFIREINLGPLDRLS
jgi:hypothetical protein